jgi:hypothetical protein
LWLSRPVEIGESSGVVHLNAVRVGADLASLHEEPGDQLRVADDCRAG